MLDSAELQGATCLVLCSRLTEILGGDSEVIEKELVYVVQTTNGRTELLEPSQFRERHPGDANSHRGTIEGFSR